MFKVEYDEIAIITINNFINWYLNWLLLSSTFEKVLFSLHIFHIRNLIFSKNDYTKIV